MMNRRVVTIFAVFLLTAPLAGSLADGGSEDSFSNDLQIISLNQSTEPVSYTHLRAHET